MLIEKVWAQNCTPDPTKGVDIATCFPHKFQTLGDVVNVLSKNIILIAGVIFFILILIAGFGVIQAAGSQDAKAMEQNKNYLTYAVIGFVIILGAFWIVQIINFVTNGSLGSIFNK